ncbi:MAG TPA: Spy/CpxP family protein refolding chaperone [Stellaceae bacterium]|nr:Spy/CpxP family protein refolding chaperone [Stellaceae bacterium]
MNKRIVAGAALVAGIAIASPMVAWSAADSGPQTQQAAPAGTPAPERAGPMMGRPGWMGGMMMQRMARLSPQQRCEERLARRAGMIAYTVEKLNLTAQQKPLWDKLQGELQAAADKERQLCGSLKAANQQTIVDRASRREQFLSARLQGLQQVRPALAQFYQALTEDQKAIIDHPFRRG